MCGKERLRSHGTDLFKLAKERPRWLEGNRSHYSLGFLLPNMEMRMVLSKNNECHLKDIAMRVPQ